MKKEEKVMATDGVTEATVSTVEESKELQAFAIDYAVQYQNHGIDKLRVVIEAPTVDDAFKQFQHMVDKNVTCTSLMLPSDEAIAKAKKDKREAPKASLAFIKFNNADTVIVEQINLAKQPTEQK